MCKASSGTYKIIKIVTLAMHFQEIKARTQDFQQDAQGLKVEQGNCLY